MTSTKWVLCVLLMPIPVLAQDAPLQWDLTAGRTWRLQVTQDEVTSEGGKELRAKKQIHDLSLSVREAIEAGDIRVALRIDRVRVEVRQAGVETKVDSDDAGAPSRETALARQEVAMRVTARGDLKTVDSFGGRALDAAPPAQRAQLHAVLGHGLLQNLFFGLLGPLPEGPAPVGTTWTTTQTLDAGTFVMTLTATNRVAEIAGGGVVRITQVVRPTVADDGDPDSAEVVLESSSIEASYELRGGMLASSKGVSTMTLVTSGRTLVTRSVVERRRLD